MSFRLQRILVCDGPGCETAEVEALFIADRDGVFPPGWAEAGTNPDGSPRHLCADCFAKANCGKAN